MRNPLGARVTAEMGGTGTQRGECDSAFDAHLGDLLAFEHLRHHIPQILQVIQDDFVSCDVLLRVSCGPSQLIAEWGV